MAEARSRDCGSSRGRSRGAWFTRSRGTSGAAIVLVAALLGACSSSSTGTTTTAAGTTSGKQTVSVMLDDAATSTVVPSPQVFTLGKVYEAWVNSHGGINGVKLSIVDCDDQGSASVAADCARQAIQDHVAAVAVGITLDGPSILPILQAAHIAYVAGNPLTSEEYTNPDAYDPGSGVIGANEATMYGLKAQGCTKIGILAVDVDLDQSQLTAEVQSVGADLTKLEVYPGEAPDVTSQVDTLMGSNPKCMFLEPETSQFTEVMNAIRQSSLPNITVGVAAGAAPLSDIQSLGATAKNLVIGNNGPLPTDSSGNALFDQLMKPYGTSSETLFSWSAFISLETIVAAAKKAAGTVSNASEIAALNQLSGVTIPGLSGPITVSATGNGLTQYPRVINWNTTVYQTNGSGVLQSAGKASNIVDGVAYVEKHSH
jgi:ABC-type branched-subunit amino acid transport system substrate-binding protein